MRKLVVVSSSHICSPTINVHYGHAPVLFKDRDTGLFCATTGVGLLLLLASRLFWDRSRHGALSLTAFAGLCARIKPSVLSHLLAYASSFHSQDKPTLMNQLAILDTDPTRHSRNSGRGYSKVHSHPSTYLVHQISAKSIGILSMLTKDDLRLTNA